VSQEKNPNLDIAMRWLLLLVAVAAGVQPAWTRWHQLQPVLARGVRHLTRHGPRPGLQPDAASVNHVRDTAGPSRDFPALSTSIRRLETADLAGIREEVSVQPQPAAQEKAGNDTALPPPPAATANDPGIHTIFTSFVFNVNLSSLILIPTSSPLFTTPHYNSPEE
jgi:hypothetical protein